MRWSTDDIPALGGKTIIVTGANTGLGFESALALASRGATVVLACRSSARAEESARRIRAQVPDAVLIVMVLDLADLASVAGFAATYARSFDRLDVLMNNAGVMSKAYALTRAGFEQQMAVNHLGHFALTGQLLPLLLGTPGSRVVTVSSAGHHLGRMDRRDPFWQQRGGFTPFGGYARSKLANLLFTHELQRRLERAGADCRSIAAHPGASQTDLGREMEDMLVFRVVQPVLTRIIGGPAHGALSQIRAAVDPGARGGSYYGPLFGMSGPPVRARSSRASHDRELARWLWEQSELTTGVRYAFDRG